MQLSVKDNGRGIPAEDVPNDRVNVHLGTDVTVNKSRSFIWRICSVYRSEMGVKRNAECDMRDSCGFRPVIPRLE